MVPNTSKVELRPEDREQLSKGFQPVNSPVAFVIAFTNQIEAEIRLSDDPKLKFWGLGVTNYEIVRTPRP